MNATAPSPRGMAPFVVLTPSRTETMQPDHTMILETVKVKSDDTEMGYVIMNKSDFNGVEHELFDPNKKDVVDEKLPTIKALPQHLATLNTADEVNALLARETRPSAMPLYDARLADIAADAE